jgi:hypothetical protein
MRKTALAWMALATACGPSAIVPVDASGVDAPLDAHVARPDAWMSDAGQRTQIVNLFVVDAHGAVSGAEVTVDDANGQRQTITTDTGGMAMLPRVGWGSGRVSFTVVASGHPMTSYAGYAHSDVTAMTTPSGAIMLTLQGYWSAASLSGQLLSTASPSDSVWLGASVGNQLTVTGNSYAGDIERNLAFDLFAFEATYTVNLPYGATVDIVRAAHVTHVAVARSAVLDIDLSALPPLVTESGTFPLPPDGSRVQAGIGAVNISDDDSAGRSFWGLERSVALDANGVDIDFTTQHFDVTAPHPVTSYSVETPERVYSRVSVDGLPASRGLASSAAWLEPPMRTSPARQALTDTITLDHVDASVDVVLAIQSAMTTVWDVFVPRGATSVVIPAPPASIDTSGWTSVTAYIDACEPWPGHAIACRRRAGGDTIALTL